MSEPARVIAFPQRDEAYTDLHGIRQKFGYSERWWRYRLAEQGFPKHRYGGHWRFLASEVEAWLHDQERKSRAG